MNYLMCRILEWELKLSLKNKIFDRFLRTHGEGSGDLSGLGLGFSGYY